MDTVALDFEDRRRMAFATLKLRAEQIMERFSDEPDMWFFTDSDVLAIAETWTTSDLNAECVMDAEGLCETHADYHLLSFMVEGAVQAMTGGDGR